MRCVHVRGGGGPGDPPNGWDPPQAMGQGGGGGAGGDLRFGSVQREMEGAVSGGWRAPLGGARAWCSLGGEGLGFAGKFTGGSGGGGAGHPSVMRAPCERHQVSMRPQIAPNPRDRPFNVASRACRVHARTGTFCARANGRCAHLNCSVDPQLRPTRCRQAARRRCGACAGQKSGQGYRGMCWSWGRRRRRSHPDALACALFELLLHPRRVGRPGARLAMLAVRLGVRG